jgi:predicted secreted hydrolase
MMKAHHYEQSGAIRGTVTVDGEATAIAGVGQRDHSWGVRDMRAPASWRWLSCQFGEGLCFNATQVDVLGMRVQGGFVLHGGVTEALESWRYEATHTTSSFWPDTLGVVLTAKSGARFALEAEVTTPLPVIATTQSDDVLVTAARAKYRWGAQTADGMVEFMEQLR